MASLIAIFDWLNGLSNAISLPLIIAGLLVITRDSVRRQTSWLQMWFWFISAAIDVIGLLWSTLHGHADIGDVARFCICTFWIYLTFRNRPPPPRKRHPLREASAAIRAMMDKLRERALPIPEPI